MEEYNIYYNIENRESERATKIDREMEENRGSGKSNVDLRYIIRTIIHGEE